MSQWDKDGNKIEVDEITKKSRELAFDQLNKKAILINLNYRQIQNMPIDVVFSETVSKAYGINEDNFIQIRKFMFNPQHLAKIRDIGNDAIVTVYNITRPWGDTGMRILPIQYYDDFKETFSKQKDEFEEAVKEFVDNYDDYVAEAKKNLGKAFNKADYPSKTSVADMFELEIKTHQLPDIDDFRLNLSGTELMNMKKEITENYEASGKKTLTKVLDYVEDKRAFELLSVVEEANSVYNYADIEMRIAELKDSNDLKEEPTKEEPKESMMVIDDFDEDDVDDIMDFEL